MKKILSVLLLACMLVTVVAACQNEKDPLPSVTTEGETLYGATEETSADSIQEDSLPDLTALRKRNSENGVSLYVVSNMTATDSPGYMVGDNTYVIDETTAQIFKNIKNDLGVSEIRWRSTTRDDLEGYVKGIAGSANKSDTRIDVIIGDPEAMVTLSTLGFLSPINYYDKYIDLSNSWYPENIVGDTRIGGNSYFVIGDMWNDYSMSVYGYVFNKELLSKVNVDDKALYSLVREGKWTVDEMIRIFGNYYVDSDKDGKASARDGYGVTVNAQAIFSAAGFKYYELDGEGITQDLITMTSDITGDRSRKLFNSLSELVFSKGQVFGSPVFEEGNTISGIQSLYFYFKLAKETDINFGIIPIPKYDASQENYYSGSYDSNYAMFGIFSGNKDLVYEENAAAFIEYMGYYGKNVLHDTRIRELFGDSYSSHTDDVYMLELIRRSRRIDFPSAVSKVSVSWYSGLEKGQAWEQFVNTFKNQSRTLADNARKLSTKYIELTRAFQNPYLYPYK